MATQKIPLYDVIKSSYKSAKDQKKEMKKYGYIRDKKLSNHNEQIYYNPTDREMLMTVAGTHNLADWGTNLYLAAGKLKQTNRYKEADKVLKEAKKKYHPKETIVSGHSMGSAISGYIASKEDHVVTLDGAYTIGQKTRSNNTHYRTKGDVVSLLGSGAKHTVNLKNNNFKTGFLPIDAYRAHDVDNIKGKKIFV
jgi:hypothetical protein